MGFIDTLFGTKTREPSIRQKAIKVATKLGKITRFGTGKGSGDNTYEYNNYNLEILVNGRIEDAYAIIRYNGELVYNDGILSHGIWEKLLDEIYQSISITLDDRAKERKLKEKKEAILEEIKGYDSDISFGHGVCAKINKRYYSEYGTAMDEVYNIYHNNNLVFSSHNRAISKYIPGNWENIIKQYNEDMRNTRRRQAEEQTLEDIKSLRKRRNH